MSVMFYAGRYTHETLSRVGQTETKLNAEVIISRADYYIRIDQTISGWEKKELYKKSDCKRLALFSSPW